MRLVVPPSAPAVDAAPGHEPAPPAEPGSDAALTPALEAALRRVDELADKTFAGLKVPGLAYGVVSDGRLVYTRGLGTIRLGEEVPPDGRSIFRIASMTKSFTAATVLSLRDEGLIALDDRIERYVPELQSLRYPTADSPAITIRHLLTMTAGFPTDDPWGDRQQSLDLETFRRLLAGGLSFAWAPGTRFEYSNTGYGILGRLITNVAGREYKDVVRERLLAPLGMASTGYVAEELDATRLAKGYLWRGERYLDEPSDGYGALAAMGGLFSTVEDLATWVCFLAGAFPPRDDPDDGAPLSRASRREMQQPWVDAGTRLSHLSPDAMPDLERMAYGFGIFVLDDVRFGRIAGHSGGYPGFGSNMRWHPASGLGVIALMNHRYAPAALLARDLLQELLRNDAAPVRRTRPAPPTEAARAAVERLLEDWDDAAARELFAMNVDLDEPLAERKAFAATLRERHGRLTRDATTPAESATPFHLAWWLDGEKGGRVKVEILLSPELPPRVQTLGLTSVPEPPAALRRAAELLVGALATPETGPVTIDWPAALSLGPDADPGAIVRAMRATEARFAPVSLGRPIEGDGERRATFRLESPRGRVDLALAMDPESGCLESVALTPVRLEAPALD
ncbi:MAG TPA: serine hydrolase domain-containing protein [Candidatus Binatia bacterium]|nr:serine hydrolase domain-containing protein [Candidatus Binatia bacterium]